MVNKPLSSPKGLYLPHYSVGDWDFKNNVWGISNLEFISSPSSLKIGPASPSGSNLLLCKNPAVLKVTTGRLITYLRNYSIVSINDLYFRNILAPGSANDANCYKVYPYLTGTVWYLYERVNSVNVRTWSQPKSAQTANTWYRWRVSWWYAWGALQVSLDLEVDGQWQQLGDIITVPNDLFSAETYQRIGFALPYYTGASVSYADDTEVWETA